MSSRPIQDITELKRINRRKNKRRIGSRVIKPTKLDTQNKELTEMFKGDNDE